MRLVLRCSEPGGRLTEASGGLHVRKRGIADIDAEASSAEPEDGLKDAGQSLGVLHLLPEPVQSHLHQGRLGHAASVRSGLAPETAPGGLQAVQAGR